LTKRAKASLQRHHADAPAPRKPKRASPSTNSLARPADWSGNQTRLHKLASPVPDLPQESRAATRHLPNLFLPKPEGEPQNPFSHYRGLADSVEPLSKRKNIEVLPAEDHGHPDTAKNKDIIRTFGSKANTLLAVAMEETNTVTSNYSFGDIYPNGLPKKDDAANFGLYKMNWTMIRQTDTGKSLIEKEWAHQTQEIRGTKQDFSPTDWSVEVAVGHKINADTAIATTIMVEAMEMWHAEIAPDPRHPTKGNFWAGHRAGWTGLNNPGSADWNDILDYYDAVMAIKARLDSDKEGKLTTGSSRIGVKVINI
jgi:hypothetical protein